MARRYSVTTSDTNTAATTIGGITSAATVRPHIYDILCGSDASPADNAASYAIQRYTAAGTSTAVVPQAIDPANASLALASAGKAHSGEPTYTSAAILLEWAQNQRVTFRWVASPSGTLILPATAANGAGAVVVAVGGSAVNTIIVFHYEE